MKLRNKKTGEIISSRDLLTDEFMKDLFSRDLKYFNSKLKKIEEEWKDYEEPKKYWYINTILNCVQDIRDDCGDLEDDKAIGNCFETKEEAEKALEKLKAWKRLKDKGFRFDGIAGMGNEIYFKANEQFTHIMVDEYTDDKTEKEYVNDLMLLFGGEK